MAGYTKLFSDIVDSSIWDENAEICKVWVTILALCNENGFVRGSVGWLASKAKVPVNTCQQALERFHKPDIKSRNPANDGRRIESVEFGWVVLNYGFFRDEYRHLSTEPRKIYQREWMRKKRKKSTVNNCQQVSTSSTPASASASVSVLGKERGEGEGEGQHKPRSEKPTLEEMKEYGNSIGLPLSEIERCRDHYEGNGWKVGKNPMKDWQAVMRNWKRGWQERGGANGNGHYNGKPKANIPEALPGQW